MNFSKDNSITTNITRDEGIQFSDTVEKNKQERLETKSLPINNRNPICNLKK